MKNWHRLAGRAEDWLMDLGQNPQDVAQALLDMGVRGVRKALSPLANYVSLMVGRTCLVEGQSLHLMSARARVAVSVLLPAPCLAFQLAFDAGDYPAMEVRTVRPGDRYLQTPWGVATATCPCFPGVLWAVADLGAGLMARRAWAQRHLTGAAQRLAIDMGEWLAFGYDGPWAVVPWEFVEGRAQILKTVEQPVFRSQPERALRLVLNDLCRGYLEAACPGALLPAGTVVAIRNESGGRMAVRAAGDPLVRHCSKSSYVAAAAVNAVVGREVLLSDLELILPDDDCRGR